MIGSQNYFIKYLVIVTLFSFAQFRKYRAEDVPQNQANNNDVIFLMALISLFIGLRPVSPDFGDMTYYDKVINLRFSDFKFDFDVENLLFDNFLNWWSYRGFSSTAFFVLVAFIYIGALTMAIRRFFKANSMFALVAYLGAFSTFSYGTNGLKAGMAASVFLIGLAYHDNWKVWIPALFISWGIHHSMMFPIAAFVVTMFYNKPKTYFYFWLVCLIMAIMHVTAFQGFFANFTDEKGASYLLSDGLEWGGGSGLRLDFILYSVIPIFVGYFASINLKIHSALFDRLLCMYLLCNGIWMLCMYVNYNNRIAYLSWFMYPILLLLPALDNKWIQSSYIKPNVIAWLHLSFTWFMQVIYY